MENEPVWCIGQPATGDDSFQGGVPPDDVSVVSCWIGVLLPRYVRVERLDARVG
jgi:hypothetical protein